MLASIPPAPREVIARALIDRVIPALVTVIEDSADDLAVDHYGASATVFDVERCANDLLHALADLLVIAPAPMRGTRELLRFHQLQQVEYSAAYFRVKPSATSANAKAEQLDTSPGAPSSVPTASARTLSDIKREVDQRRNGNGRPAINFVPVDPSDDDRRIANERAQLARQREQERKLDALQRHDSRRDAREETDLQPPGAPSAPPVDKQKCARPGCKNLFTPIRPNHKYCSERCSRRVQSKNARQRKKQAQTHDQDS